MTDKPRWHGWATPDQVRQMMHEMYEFLKENQETCHFMTVSAESVVSNLISGLKLLKQPHIARSVVEK